MDTGGKSSLATCLSGYFSNVQSEHPLGEWFSLKGHCNHNPNKVLGISQEDLAVREPKVTQGQSESYSGRSDVPGLQQWGVKEGHDAVTVQWIKFTAPLCQHLPT